MISLYKQPKLDIHWPNFSGIDFPANDELRSQKIDIVDQLVQNFAMQGEHYHMDDERTFFDERDVRQVSRALGEIDDFRIFAYLMDQVANQLQQAEKCVLAQNGSHSIFQQLGYHLHILITNRYQSQLQLREIDTDDLPFLFPTRYEAINARDMAKKLRKASQK